MSTISIEMLQQDRLVMSVARALALANETALAKGTDPARSLVSIAEDTSAEGRTWRIHYGPRDFVNRRGGDLIVIVTEAGKVQQILRGQ